MIKIVMGSIMLIVAVSRGLAIPKYLTQLNVLTLKDQITALLTKASFVLMCAALSTGAVIILGAMWKGRREASSAAVEEVGTASEVATH
jgi:hypothetical protein